MACGNTLIFILVTSTVTVIHGMNFDQGALKTEPTEEECMKPPMKKFEHECCTLPKERIWGDMHRSVRKCLKKFKALKDGVPTTDQPDMETTTPKIGSFHRRSLRKRHRGHHNNDSCFMECVFEDQGFLKENRVDRDALFIRVSQTLSKNEKWYQVAIAGVQECFLSGINTDTKGPCRSGSEEMFRCVLKYLFFNCPSWTQNDYCTSLRKFYSKCPNGPPPEEEHTEYLPEITTDIEPDDE